MLGQEGAGSEGSAKCKVTSLVRHKVSKVLTVSARCRVSKLQDSKIKVSKVLTRSTRCEGPAKINQVQALQSVGPPRCKVNKVQGQQGAESERSAKCKI